MGLAFDTSTGFLNPSVGLVPPMALASTETDRCKSVALLPMSPRAARRMVGPVPSLPVTSLPGREQFSLFRPSTYQQETSYSHMKKARTRVL